MTNIPQIRFKGYTSDWEQRKLGEVAEFSKGSGYSKGDLTSNGSPIILYGRLYTKYETEINIVDTFVEMKENLVAMVYAFVRVYVNAYVFAMFTFASLHAY